MATAQVNEKAYIGRNNIDTIVQKAILKEKGKNTRILYAGINPSDTNTMVVCKVVELFRGKYYYEETVFNPIIKSVHTTLASTTEQFDKILKASEKYYEMKYKPNAQIKAATAYSRLLSDGKVFHNTTILDTTAKGYLSPVWNLCYNWSVRSYLNKKI